MDSALRNALRDYQRGEIGQDAALHLLARSGFSRQASVFAVDEALRHAFLDELDYGSVERLVYRLEDDSHTSPTGVSPRGYIVQHVQMQGQVHVPLQSIGSESPRASTLMLAASESGLLGRDPSDRKWTPVVSEELDLEVERLVARELPDTWVAHQRRNPEATRMRVWHSCRLDVIETGDMSDLRIDVAAPLRERAIVLETLMETFPHATVVSSLVSEGRRPERHPTPKPGEAEWPTESTRVHVRR